MEIRKYGGKYPEEMEILKQMGLLSRNPVQNKRDDLEFDEGVDIVYYFRNMTPAVFAKVADLILMLAYKEAERYKSEKYKFSKLSVNLNRTQKGRKALSSARRDYIAAKHMEADIMIWGEFALGYELPEEYKKRPYLINKVEEIINIPQSQSPGAYVNKQRPYIVSLLVISIRAGGKGIS